MALPKTYRALQLVKPGPVANFKLVNLSLNRPAPGSVLVKVAACAVAFRDVLDRQGAFKFIRQPTVLGHEFSGTIAAVGEGVQEWKEGDRVVSLHWDQAAAWPSPLKQAGAVDSMFGLMCDGGYAEYATGRAGAFARAPAHIGLTEASCVLSTFGTVWYGAVTRARMACGQRVLVTGASGGVGTSAVLIAKALGCHVTSVTSSSAKVGYLKQLGSDDVLVCDAKGKFQCAAPVDTAVEAVGGPTFASSLRSVTPGGKLVLVGNVENSVSQLPLGYLILNSISIVGSDSIHRREMEQELVPFMKSHNLAPIVSKVITLEEVGAAHETLEARGATGRIVIQL